jgi:hypothetical protein
VTEKGRRRKERSGQRRRRVEAYTLSPCARNAGSDDSTVDLCNRRHGGWRTDTDGTGGCKHEAVEGWFEADVRVGIYRGRPPSQRRKGGRPIRGGASSQVA